MTQRTCCQAPVRRNFACLFLAMVAIFVNPQRPLAQTRDSSPGTTATTEVVVTGEALADTLTQSDPVGPYGQPEWTTMRAFGASRVYVRPPGTLEFVNFWTPELKDGETE